MKSSILAILGGASTALAAVRGFNYASQQANYQAFEAQFRTAAGLTGANDYTSARLYTMIQEGTANTPISAIQAAIDTGSTLLLGLWASQEQDGFNNELAALTNAINQYGTKFTDLVVGISVGSEDLYRISPTGIANKSDRGQSPSVLVDYIRQVRELIRGTTLASKPVGHVDTWNVFVNGSNADVIAASDFLGLDEYPYFETTNANSIDNGKTLFFDAYNKVAAVAQGKPIWITEAGWPTSGPVSGQAVASVENAERFWQDVACELERRDINTWWYILADAGASPSFGVSNNGQPLYDLVCKAPTSSSSTTTPGSTTSASSGPSSSTAGSSPSTTLSTSVGGGAQPTTSATIPSTTSSGPGSTTTTATTSTPTGGFNGAGTKVEGSLAGLVFGAIIAAFAL